MSFYQTALLEEWTLHGRQSFVGRVALGRGTAWESLWKFDPGRRTKNEFLMANGRRMGKWRSESRNHLVFDAERSIPAYLIFSWHIVHAPFFARPNDPYMEPGQLAQTPRHQILKWQVNWKEKLHSDKVQRGVWMAVTLITSWCNFAGGYLEGVNSSEARNL